MLDFLLHRPVAVLMSAFGLIALGAVSLRILPVSLLPDVPIPEISVQVSCPNTSARELENTVVMPLRNQLLQVGRLHDIRSQSRNGNASIVLELDFGTNTDLAFIEINEKIDQAMNYLPRAMERPRVIKSNVSDIPVFYLSVVPRDLDSLSENLRSREFLELSEFTRLVLKRRIEQLPQIAFVDVSGFAEAELVITPDAAALQSLGLTERDLETVLQQNNLSPGSIALQENHYQYHVRFNSGPGSVKDLEQIRFMHQGRVLRLGEIASFSLETRTPQGFYLHDGQEAIVFSIYKQADAQLFDLKSGFNDLLGFLKKDYPQLEFHLSNDQSELLVVSINNLYASLAYGSLFAFLIILLFFREWRLPLLIGIAVPVSLIIGILGFYLAGISINVISLAGLILGVGLLVDNAIIVVENIRQHRQMGLPLARACVEGSNEVIRPLISSALTTCSVFLPLVFLSGITGALFYDQAMSITLVIGASLMAAYILIPVLVNLVERRRKPPAGGTEGYKTGSERTFYYRTTHAVIRHPVLSALFFTGLIGAGFWLVLRLPKEGFPPLSRHAVELHIDWGEPVGAPENARRIRRFLKTFRADLTSSNAFAGEQQFLMGEQSQVMNEATVVLYGEKETYSRLVSGISAYFRKNYPAATFFFVPLKNVFDEIFGGDRPMLIAHVQSVKTRQTPSSEEIQPFLNLLKKEGIAFTLIPRQETYTLSILKEEALLYQVPYEEIHARLQTLLGQRAAGAIRTANTHIPIVFSNGRKDFRQLLESATVDNPDKKPLPLKYFIRTERQLDPKVIQADKSGEALEIAIPRANLSSVREIRQLARQASDLSVSFSGQLFDNQSIIREISIVALISLALLYFILAAQFESLVQPFIVLLAIPVGVMGAAACLLLFGQSINIMSLIGFVVMGGIAVNDSILKVDTINRLVRTLPLEEAIHRAGHRRLRAIVMTSLTTTLSLLPVLFSTGLGAELQSPLEYAVMGGLIMTTISSLYFVPALYVLVYRRRLRGSADNG